MSDKNSMSWAASALDSLRKLGACNLVGIKLDIALLQIALISDAHEPHLTSEKRQEALEALVKPGWSMAGPTICMSRSLRSR